jgi:DNA polymerase-3 subunit gamma/tau
VESPLALYRRYRPETFAEVIGQDHVTEPLRAALANNRVNHAYLFSGPRGCGKTTSARILARSLNCELAPVADPCGECRSCRDLARGGPGSIDVIEIDAASHGGVDDARDLREKAFFAPVASKYKVYIIDEAHMVTPQGFNALLKLVEEPPPHLRFIFATTEPDKVLPTIRSRTHHYPFRLIPPRLLSSYLSELCEREGVPIEPAALPLVVRAGGGSARDTLSVLDQLMGGSGADGVTHQLATGLLGYTPDALLDEVVEAFAAGDGAAVFGVVDKVIETGQDPRRFAEDLLRRLRDLVIVAAVPDAPASGLIDVSEDQGERLVAQAARYGGVELSRAADLVATGLTDMRGATAPRLLLELVCARVLLPGADHSTDGLLARLDRLERRVAISGAPATVNPQVAPPPPVVSAAGDTVTPAPPTFAEPAGAGPSDEASSANHPLRSSVAPGGSGPSTASGAPSDVAAPTVSAPSASPAPTTTAAGSSLSLIDVRRLWPDIVEATKLRRRVAWMHLTQNSQVVSVDGNVLTLGFSNAGARDSFLSGGCDEVLRQAAIDVVGADWKIETLVDPGAQSGTPAAPAPAADRAVSSPAEQPAEQAATTAASPDGPPDGPPDWAVDEPARQTDPVAVAAAREAILQTRQSGSAPTGTSGATDAGDDVSHPDDPDADTDGLDTTELLRRELGAEVIDEIPHS